MFVLKKAYRLEPLILKHYATKSPIEVQKTPVPYKEMNEKRSALNIDLKSALSKSASKHKKDATKSYQQDSSKSAELNQLKEESSSNSSSNTNLTQNTQYPSQIDHVGK